jgi:hypothetical protein
LCTNSTGHSIVLLLILMILLVNTTTTSFINHSFVAESIGMF